LIVLPFWFFQPQLIVNSSDTNPHYDLPNTKTDHCTQFIENFSLSLIDCSTLLVFPTSTILPRVMFCIFHVEILKWIKICFNHKIICLFYELRDFLPLVHGAFFSSTGKNTGTHNVRSVRVMMEISCVRCSPARMCHVQHKTKMTAVASACLVSDTLKRSGSSKTRRYRRTSLISDKRPTNETRASVLFGFSIC